MIATTSRTTRFRIALESHASEYKTELRAPALDQFTEYYEILGAVFAVGVSSEVGCPGR